MGRILGTLKLELLEYWHASAGEAGGADLDLTVVQDALGLPYLPARSVKGLLRDCVRLAETFGAVEAGSEDRLFGRFAHAGEDSSTRGELEFTSAELPEAFRTWVSSTGPTSGKHQLGGLFETLAQTAIDDGGVAKTGSLRRMQATVPCELTATIGVRPDVDLAPEQVAELRQILDTSSPLLRSLGLGRRRGLGRCRCAFEGSADE